MKKNVLLGIGMTLTGALGWIMTISGVYVQVKWNDYRKKVIRKGKELKKRLDNDDVKAAKTLIDDIMNLEGPF